MGFLKVWGFGFFDPRLGTRVFESLTDSDSARNLGVGCPPRVVWLEFNSVQAVLDFSTKLSDFDVIYSDFG